MLRILKWFVGVVLALLVLAAIAVELMDWDFLKPVITDRMAQAAGREAAIAGDISISLLPRPRISIDGLSLANPGWAAHPQFIEIERLRIAPGLTGLLLGRVHLAQIDIDAPVIRLNERADGSPNWVLQGAETDDSDDAADDDAAGDSIAVGEIVVSDAVIRYRVGKTEDARVFEIPSLRFDDDGESLVASARVAAGDQAIELEADTDSLLAWPGAGGPFDGKIRVHADDSRLHAEFSTSKSSPFQQWNSRIEADVQSVSQWAGLVPALTDNRIGPLLLSASLQRSGPTWKAEDISLTVMESSVEGRLSVDFADDVPVVEGSLRSNAINAAGMQAGLGGGAGETSFALASLPVLPRLAGAVELEIAQIAGLAVVFSDFSARLEAGEHRLALEQLAVDTSGGRLEGSIAIISAPDSLKADIGLSAADLAVNDVASDLAANQAPEDLPRGILDGGLTASLGPLERTALTQADSTLAALVEHLGVSRAEFSFVEADEQTRLSADLDLASESKVPSLALSGSLASRPLEVHLEGDPLSGFESMASHGLRGRASSAGLEIAVDTTLGAVVRPEKFGGHVSVSAGGEQDIEPWLDRALPPMPGFEASVRLQREKDSWIAESLRIESEGSDIEGRVRVSTAARPRIDAELTAEPLDLTWLSRSASSNSSQQASQQASPDPARSTQTDDGSVEGRAPFDLSPLESFDAALNLTASEVIFGEAEPLQQVELAATLDAGELNLDPLEFGLAGGTVSLAGLIDVAGEPLSARLEAGVSDVVLSRLADTISPLEDRLGLLSGDLQLTVTQGDQPLGDDMVAPFIGRLTIEPSSLRLVDAEAGTDVSIALRTRNLEGGEQRFEIDGTGSYDGHPLSLRFRGDRLLDARLPDRPYSVDLEADVVESRFELDGTLLRPLALAGMDLEMSLQGPSPARLRRLLGVPLPDLPSYELTGKLGLEQGRWTLSAFSGRVGDSDLQGRLAFDASPSPPLLTGRLHSDSVDIEDFGEIFGAGSGAAEAETTSASNDGQAEGDRFVLPDAPFAGEAWRQVDADVRYRGASVRAADVPLSEVVLEFRLQDGVGKFAPVGFGVGEGRLDFTLTLDANQDPTKGTLGVQVQAVDLRDALGEWDLAEDSVGIVAAEGKFWVRGRSIAALLGSADGGLVMLMKEGNLDALLVQLAGLHVGEAFLSWIGDTDPVPINCAYIDLKSRGGALELDTFVIDSAEMIFTAGGEVDMDDERVDVSIMAHPRDPSVLVGRTPLHLGGTFAAIDPGIHGGKLGVRAGAAVGLGAIAGPVGALLPLLDIGDSEGTGYCQGLASRTLEAIEDAEAQSEPQPEPQPEPEPQQ